MEEVKEFVKSKHKMAAMYVTYTIIALPCRRVT